MFKKDQSIRPGADQNRRIREGTLAQLVEEAEKTDGRVLNALDIPLPSAGLVSMATDRLASNVVAIEAMNGQAGAAEAPAAGEVSWGLAATAGAYHTWHIDCNGFATIIQVDGGSKLWIVGHPKGEVDDRPDFGTAFGHTNVFASKHFDLDGSNAMLWGAEAVLLREGDILCVFC